MAPAVARKPSRVQALSRRPPTDGWWGDGPPPWKRWPGVSITLEAKWSAKDRRWESLDGLYYFDAEAAQLAVDFFPTFLTHHQGEFAGEPFTLLPYQDQLVIRPLFGWKKVADGRRRFRRAFLAVPKGNGKSPLAAGVAIFMTFCDGEQGAQVYCAAADREQAGIVFNNCRLMVLADDELSKRATVLKKVIEVGETNSYLKVTSADVATKHGPNIHCLDFDEFHTQKTRDLYETLQRGTVKRRQPIIFITTTAGDDEETICMEEWDYAERVMSGTIEDHTVLPIIFQAAREDDWKDPKVHKRVNPGLGITVKADALEAECKAAQNEPRKLNDFLRFHLNRWVNQATAWITVDKWDDCQDPKALEGLATLELAAGLDLAQKYDLTSLTLVFKRVLKATAQPLAVDATAKDESGREHQRQLAINFAITPISFFWIPEETMREREKIDRVAYSQYRNAGLLRVTPGNITDFDQIRDDIRNDIATQFPMLKQAEIGYDPAFATQLALQLQSDGFKVIEIPQTFKHFSEPCQVFEALLMAKRILHDGNRLLRAHVENARVKTDESGRIRPVKSLHASKRMDGLIALLMGLSRLMFTPQPQTSIYETRDPFVL